MNGCPQRTLRKKSRPWWHARCSGFERVSDVFAAVGQLHRALDYHLERQNVLTSNVAHVDTPGYRPNDLVRADPSEFAGVLDVALSRTDKRHLDVTLPAQARTGQLIQDLSAGAGADGNYVSVDREASKLASNHLRYDVVSAIVSAELRQLHYAASDGKG